MSTRGIALVLRQRLVLIGDYPDGIWSCAWCAAKLTDGVITHREDCLWIAQIREARP